jgi:hypothetical protein
LLLLVLCVATMRMARAQSPVIGSPKPADVWEVSYWTTPGDSLIVSREVAFVADGQMWELRVQRFDHHAFAVTRNYASQPIPGGLPRDGFHLSHYQVARNPDASFELRLRPEVRHWFQFDVESRSVRVPRAAAFLWIGGVLRIRQAFGAV